MATLDTKTRPPLRDGEHLEACLALCQRGQPLSYITFVCGRLYQSATPVTPPFVCLLGSAVRKNRKAAFALFNLHVPHTVAGGAALLGSLSVILTVKVT